MVLGPVPGEEIEIFVVIKALSLRRTLAKVSPKSLLEGFGRTRDRREGLLRTLTLAGPPGSRRQALGSSLHGPCSFHHWFCSFVPFRIQLSGLVGPH